MTDERVFKPRTMKSLFKMSNNNTEYVREDTFENCEIVRKLFEQDLLLTGKRKKMCLTEISARTGVRLSSVTSATNILSYMRKPILRKFGLVRKKTSGGKPICLTMVVLRKNEG